VIAGGEHSLLLFSNGSVLAWGSNSDGQLGLPPSCSDAAGHLLQGLPAIVSVAAGHRHSLALTADGSVYAWGANVPGQLGDGSLESTWRPTCVLSSRGSERVVRVAAGRAHSMALLSNGTVMAWGWDAFGQLGQEEPQGAALRPRAVALPQGVRVCQIAAGGVHSLALDEKGQVWGWGGNGCGQVGEGRVSYSSRPVVVLEEASSIAAGASHSLAVARGGLYGWGSNANGELGDG
ncbi:hypothetical protein GUITHDRAFT_59944, partial [Guillardia theta CCMP2712]